MVGGYFLGAAAARIRLPLGAAAAALPRRQGGTTGQRGLPATGVSFFYFFYFLPEFFYFFM